MLLNKYDDDDVQYNWHFSAVELVMTSGLFIAWLINRLKHICKASS